MQEHILDFSYTHASVKIWSSFHLTGGIHHGNSERYFELPPRFVVVRCLDPHTPLLHWLLFAFDLTECRQVRGTKRKAETAG